MAGSSSAHSEQAVQRDVEVAAQVGVIRGRCTGPGTDNQPVPRREPVEPASYEMAETAGDQMASYRAADTAPDSETDPGGQASLWVNQLRISAGASQRHHQRATGGAATAANGG